MFSNSGCMIVAAGFASTTTESLGNYHTAKSLGVNSLICIR